ncbi:ABC transporter ATP-binding protein [Solibaculum mannosilyticum]|uniref:Multidrug ABC transporter ATP-binding protein n=1 Tax=Solibaculum mannosilyticum TaxID=2780922 RepID=A0A7I8D2D2_9FIRM|nr:ABC transporter ATP-binding protein [Solibaculum mannosilyticum]BCI60991.1 multidrug ABC transporter ATP-binding protein [Solibaculum mannosilyticum]
MSENNNAEIFADEMDFETPDHAWQTVKRLWRSASEQHKRLAVVLASVVLYTFLSIIAPLYSAHIVDLLWNSIKETITTGAAFQVTWATGGRDIVFLLLIYLATALFYTLQSFLMSSFAEDLNLRLRTEISEKLNRLPLSFFDRTKTGAILSRTVNDLDKTSEALQTGMLKLFTAVGMVVGSLVMMFRFSILLTLVFLVFTGIALIATNFVSAKTLKSAMKRQQCVSNVTAQVEEAYSGRVIIKAFNQEENSSENMHKATEELAEATKKADFMINAINPVIRLINRFGQVLIAVLAGKMLLEGRLTVGVFQAFFQYANQASEPLTEAAYMVNSMQSALASLERIYKLLDEEELSSEPALPSVVDQAKGTVEFQNVRFGYTPDKILMHNINFSVKPGQKVAIVGSTGAGKTTLINLLMRFYELNGGKITLDGTNIKDMTRSNLRSNFGMVLQDTWLFGGTIAENIAYSKPDATREEIVAAAKAARVDFFVRTMSHGYDTVLSNDAENISIGQRQLLTIARVFLCDPAVIILDEATSSVDTRTEIEIGKAMKDLMKNRTSFVIAHRLSTIIDADLILFMQNGNIVEQGTHETLLKAKGAYADLYYSQFA